MQQYVVVGRIGSEVKYSDIGRVPYARISIADNTFYQDPETGEKKQFTSWIPVVGFGGKAEFMKQYLHKGMMVALSGCWRNNVTERDGQRWYSMVLRLEQIQFCDSKTKLGADESTDPESDREFVETSHTPFAEDFTMPPISDDSIYGG